jgi:hypothetical protein
MPQGRIYLSDWEIERTDAKELDADGSENGGAALDPC